MTTRTLTVSLLSTAVLLASAAVASADPADSLSASANRPIKSAIEVGVAAGYARSFGEVDSAVDGIGDLTGPGGSGELQIGYRLSPALALGAYGSASHFTQGAVLSGDSADFGAVTGGLQATYHMRPSSESDPWISLGAGVRWMAIKEGTSDPKHLFGIDFARAQFGVDYRMASWLSLAPVIGASATTYLREDTPMTDGWQDVDQHKVSVNFQAGLMGRFEILAQH